MMIHATSATQRLPPTPAIGTAFLWRLFHRACQARESERAELAAHKRTLQGARQQAQQRVGEHQHLLQAAQGQLAQVRRPELLHSEGYGVVEGLGGGLVFWGYTLLGFVRFGLV